MVGPARACDATSYTEDELVGEGFIKIGEAAFAIDPLSSSGVQKAIQSGLSASIVAHTMLSDGDAEAAKQFYEEDQQLVARQHAEWARENYRDAASRRAHRFWQDRTARTVGTRANPRQAPVRLPPIGWDTRLITPPDLSRESVPCIVGNSVVRRPAVRLPGLDRPVAFLAGAEVSGLLGDVGSGATFGCLAVRWSAKLSPERARAVITACLETGLLRPEAADQTSYDEREPSPIRGQNISPAPRARMD
jgi:hypothetical protein